VYYQGDKCEFGEFISVAGRETTIACALRFASEIQDSSEPVIIMLSTTNL
jgi:hypothetical protein